MNHAQRPTSRLFYIVYFVCLALVGLIGLGGYLYTLRPATRPHFDAGQAAADVRQVIERQADAWNRADLEGFMAGYWQSPELSFFSGNDRTLGWQATLDRYKKKYQAEGRDMGRLTFSAIDVQMADPEWAVVRGQFRLEMKQETATGLFTLVMRKLPEGWRIIHDHTSGN